MVATSFGLLGAIDDYLKVKRNNSKGISSGMKIICQIILSIIAVTLLMKFGDNEHLKKLYFVKISEKLWLQWQKNRFASLLVQTIRDYVCL